MRREYEMGGAHYRPFGRGAAGAGAPRRPVLLVIDDDDAVRGALGDVLSELGFHVTAFARPSFALSHLRRGNPVDAILLDLLMPGMSGADLLVAIRREELARDVPVVLLSGTPDAPDEVRGLGVDACLRKPVSAERLIAALSRVLEHPMRWSA
jgi:two-component system phosphate regulon response regulator OmpR